MEIKNYGSVTCSMEETNNDKGSLQRHLSKEILIRFSSNHSCRFSIYVVFYVLFLMSGAAIFSYIETPVEVALKARGVEVIQNFQATYPNISNETLNQFIDDIIKLASSGVSPGKNTANVESKWSFAESLFFTSTVLTTIGYGHVTPLTQKGKMFCIGYAIVGIPLTLVLFSALVERLFVPTVCLCEWLHQKLKHLFGPFSIRLLHLAIAVLLFVGVFVLLPAIAFASIEPSWGWLDAIYFCFISLTTVGLGDYIPGNIPQRYQSIYKYAVTIYLYSGITCLMLILSVFYDIPRLNLGTFLTKDMKTSPSRIQLTDMDSLQFMTDKKENQSLCSNTKKHNIV